LVVSFSPDRYAAPNIEKEVVEDLTRFVGGPRSFSYASQVQNLTMRLESGPVPKLFIDA
jgi:hypothetical protein